MYGPSLLPQGHPQQGESRSSWLQDERDDPWVGEAVAFSFFGDRCADGLYYFGRWKQQNHSSVEKQYPELVRDQERHAHHMDGSRQRGPKSNQPLLC